MQNSRAPDAHTSPQTQTFQYDELDRLTSAQASGTEAQGGYGPISYHYDEIGNITAKGDVDYGYNDPDHVHAVTHLTMLLQTDQKYWYNASESPRRKHRGFRKKNHARQRQYSAENPREIPRKKPASSANCARAIPASAS